MTQCEKCGYSGPSVYTCGTTGIVGYSPDESARQAQLEWDRDRIMGETMD